MIKNILGIEVAVLMGANIANEVAKEEFCETTIGKNCFFFFLISFNLKLFVWNVVGSFFIFIKRIFFSLVHDVINNCDKILVFHVIYFTSLRSIKIIIIFQKLIQRNILVINSFNCQYNINYWVIGHQIYICKSQFIKCFF